MTSADPFHLLRSLRPNRSGGYASPHKPCLLLAVISLIADGVITDNRIYLDETLRQRFTQFFNRYRRARDKDDPSMPFFYLAEKQLDVGLWQHVVREGHEAEYAVRIADRKHGGPNIVERMITYVSLSSELWAVLQTASGRWQANEVLLDYLDDYALSSDIDEIVHSADIRATEIQRLMTARLGQGEFRQRLIDQWHGCCAVTGYSMTRLLVASHIKPWRDASSVERLDGANGLLLLPNLDKVFDRGYITFAENGKIQISKSLLNPDQIGLTENMMITVKETMRDYLNHHQHYVFIQ